MQHRRYVAVYQEQVVLHELRPDVFRLHTRLPLRLTLTMLCFCLCSLKQVLGLLPSVSGCKMSSLALTPINCFWKTYYAELLFVPHMMVAGAKLM